MKHLKALITLLSMAVAMSFCSCDKDENDNGEESLHSSEPYMFMRDYEDSVAYQLTDGITEEDWMSNLSDNEKVCNLSIPGTHDTMTGMGFYDKDLQYIFNMTAISQLTTLTEQLEGGIRFFDIRPVVSIDTLKHEKVLRCAHGISEIRTTFEEALDMITDYLGQHKGEFAIVKIQADNGVENQVNWWPMMREFIQDYHTSHNNIFADWHPGITVGEVRGKILMLSRINFDDMRGAFCDWQDEDPDLDDNVHLEKEKSCKMYSPDKSDSTTLYVQDYYKTNKPERLQRKKKAVLDMLAEARLCTADAANDTWVINHTSAYTSVSARGYIENANSIHQVVINDMLEHPGKRVGIIPMDFAGFDHVSCVINGYYPYTSEFMYDKKPMSRSLTNLLIMSNFK